MKKNHVLIDYENVQPDVASALAAEIFEVWVFVGVQQTKVKFDLLELVQKKGTAAHVIKMTSSGRNALDFHMSCYLGRLIAMEPQSFFHVVAKDTGLDSLIEHLRAEGHRVARCGSVLDIPVAKMGRDLNEDEKLSRILEYLVRRGEQRPASMKTLLGSIAALFEPKLGEEECQGMAETLRRAGVFEVVGTRLRYGLPVR